MANIAHIAYGSLVSKANKFGIEAYTKDGVKTVLKDNKVIKTISKERLFDDQVELTQIVNYKNNEPVKSTLLRKDFDDDGRVLSATLTKHDEQGSNVNIFLRGVDGKFTQIKQSADEFLQNLANFLAGDM